MLVKIKVVKGISYNSTTLRHFRNTIRRSGAHSYAKREVVGLRIKLKT